MTSMSEEPPIPNVLTSSASSSAGVGDDSSASAVQEAAQTTPGEESAREPLHTSGVNDATGEAVESQPGQEVPERER